jgi:hypothetical protein
LLIERCIFWDSRLEIEIGWVPGEGWIVSRLSSRNMYIDNPMAMVEIPLVNLHQCDKKSMLL